ncbi:MAG TPA: hypothetical protein VF444_04100 [Pseudonocardiaceae bacterium]
MKLSPLAMSDTSGYLLFGETAAFQGVRDGRTELATRPWPFDVFAAAQLTHHEIVNVPTGIPPFDQERRA